MATGTDILLKVYCVGDFGYSNDELASRMDKYAEIHGPPDCILGKWIEHPTHINKYINTGFKYQTYWYAIQIYSADGFILCMKRTWR